MNDNMPIDLGPRLSQGAKPHGDTKLGLGQRTHKQSGCLFACLTGVARVLGVGPLDLSIADAHALVVAAGTDEAPTFIGSALMVRNAAAALGLDLHARRAVSWPVVRAELQARRPVILGLDYRTGASSGFSDADHFVVAIGSPMTSFVTAADPALKETLILDTEAMTYRGSPARAAEMLLFRRRAAA